MPLLDITTLARFKTVNMTSRADTEFLLSDEYNPADESLFRFRQSYSHLVRYHDSLQEQRNAKEQKRADMYKAERETLGEDILLKRL